MSRDPPTVPPADDSDVVAWTACLGLDGLIDMHVHFLPEQVLSTTASRGRCIIGYLRMIV